MKEKNKNIVNRFFVEIDQMEDGRMKFRRAKKLVVVNQYKRGWRKLVSRDLARQVNKTNLIIK